MHKAKLCGRNFPPTPVHETGRWAQPCQRNPECKTGPAMPNLFLVPFLSLPLPKDADTTTGGKVRPPAGPTWERGVGMTGVEVDPTSVARPRRFHIQELPFHKCRLWETSVSPDDTRHEVTSERFRFDNFPIEQFSLAPIFTPRQTRSGRGQIVFCGKATDFMEGASLPSVHLHVPRNSEMQLNFVHFPF